MRYKSICELYRYPCRERGVMTDVDKLLQRVEVVKNEFSDVRLYHDIIKALSAPPVEIQREAVTDAQAQDALDAFWGVWYDGSQSTGLGLRAIRAALEAASLSRPPPVGAYDANGVIQSWEDRPEGTKVYAPAGESRPAKKQMKGWPYDDIEDDRP